MSDHSELKRLADAATAGQWKSVDYGSLSGKSSHWYVETDDGKNVAFDDSGDPAPNHWEARGEQDMKYIAAANPSAVLALIAEVERLNEECDKAWRHDLNDKNNVHVLAAEVEALRSQVATLQSDANSWQSGYEEGRRMGTKTALDEREELRKDADRYRWLCRQRSKVWRYIADTPSNKTDEYIDSAMSKGDKP